MSVDPKRSTGLDNRDGEMLLQLLGWFAFHVYFDALFFAQTEMSQACPIQQSTREENKIQTVSIMQSCTLYLFICCSEQSVTSCHFMGLAFVFTNIAIGAQLTPIVDILHLLLVDPDFFGNLGQILSSIIVGILVVVFPFNLLCQRRN